MTQPKGKAGEGQGEVVFYGPKLDEANVRELRQQFVHDFQYRFSPMSDHYTVVAMFALETARKAVAALSPPPTTGERDGDD
jgi:hypothetical protein